MNTPPPPSPLSYAELFSLMFACAFTMAYFAEAHHPAFAVVWGLSAVFFLIGGIARL